MKMTHDERIRRLKSMLGQVADGGLEAIETPAPRRGLEAMEDTSASAQNFVAQAALQKLKSGQPVSPAEAGALEAIVLPDKRPVVFIRNGVYDPVPMAEWAHLNTPDVNFRLNVLFASIGRVELPLITSVLYGGTGFVVGPNLLMTNRHVARLFTEGLGTRLTYRTGGSAIDFKQEINASPNATLLEVTGVAMIHPFWDMALLKVEGLAPSARALPLSVAPPDELLDQDVVVVGYPAQDFRNDLTVQNQVFQGKYGVKRLAPGKTRKRERIDSFENTVNAMTHDSSTLGGNSGSAVIHVKTGKVVGLHFAGEYLKANYCVPTYELARDRRVVDAGLNFEKSVAATNDWAHSWLLADGEAAPAVTASSPAALDRGTVTATMGATTVMNLMLPIQISVTIGTPATAGATAAVAAPLAAVEKVPVIYDDLEGRAGYRENFLGLANDVTVPMPTLTTAGKTVAARLDDGSYELKYHKFSIVIHKRRRLALFTASNVDWREHKRLVDGERPTRDDLNGFDGTENWVIDPRIPFNNQLPDYFYTKDGTAFDKGHLVRRDDVTWGDSFEDMQKGNGDTFHTTNCSPQTAEFNRPAEQNWGALEKMVENNTKSEKVCIFSGPVLDDEDEYFHGLIKSGVRVSIQIPRKFWKIIVAKKNGAPAAFGFVLDQDLSGVDLHAELAIPDAWKNYLRPISDIEEYLHGLAKLTAFKPWDQYEQI